MVYSVGARPRSAGQDATAQPQSQQRRRPAAISRKMRPRDNGMAGLLGGGVGLLIAVITLRNSAVGGCTLSHWLGVDDGAEIPITIAGQPYSWCPVLSPSLDSPGCGSRRYQWANAAT
ncbi:hypothetical protein NJB18091_44020 [Mycobacterium marinum]|nr:hypothetical protein NJB18091_44020 [Mycobacterium marinum]